MTKTDSNLDNACLEKWQDVQDFYVKNNLNFLNLKKMTQENAVKAAWEIERCSIDLLYGIRDKDEVLGLLEKQAKKIEKKYL